ncbi:hypothetical protein FKW77_007275 [Venturia effusa]|uniref:Extracellular membrane protein CFEM domain-containing protein n=1 Tax=Venturia effusa TaxID=50376 RepID=A0A517LFW6_9PEZI|nr:hypothetical protein FKW77_007275 [Venturia effusa]
MKPSILTPVITFLPSITYAQGVIAPTIQSYIGTVCCPSFVKKCTDRHLDGCVALNLEYCVREVNDDVRDDYACTVSCIATSKIPVKDLHVYKTVDKIGGFGYLCM